MQGNAGHLGTQSSSGSSANGCLKAKFLMKNLIIWAALFGIIASGFTPGEAGLADPGRPATAERAVSEAGSEVVVPVSVEAGEVILDVSN
jgi:hypothetical protein